MIEELEHLREHLENGDRLTPCAPGRPCGGQAITRSTRHPESIADHPMMRENVHRKPCCGRSVDDYCACPSLDWLYSPIRES